MAEIPQVIMEGDKKFLRNMYDGKGVFLGDPQDHLAVLRAHIIQNVYSELVKLRDSDIRFEHTWMDKTHMMAEMLSLLQKAHPDIFGKYPSVREEGVAVVYEMAKSDPDLAKPEFWSDRSCEAKYNIKPMDVLLSSFADLAGERNWKELRFFSDFQYQRFIQPVLAAFHMHERLKHGYEVSFIKPENRDNIVRYVKEQIAQQPEGMSLDEIASTLRSKAFEAVDTEIAMGRPVQPAQNTKGIPYQGMKDYEVFFDLADCFERAKGIKVVGFTYEPMLLCLKGGALEIIADIGNIIEDNGNKRLFKGVHVFEDKKITWLPSDRFERFIQEHTLNLLHDDFQANYLTNFREMFRS